VEALIAVAKIGKHAVSESGDTLELVERPGGGLSVVLADGQASGKPAKAIANTVTRKAISLLAEGVRDGAVARAAADYLYTYRSGKVLATLNILSLDLHTHTLVVTRNNPAPVILIQDHSIAVIDEPSAPVGARKGVRPSITEVPLQRGLAAILFTDGLVHAGDRLGKTMDPVDFVRQRMAEGPIDPQAWADTLLEEALRLEAGRPTDDISVVVAAVLPRHGDDVRRLHVRMPL